MSDIEAPTSPPGLSFSAPQADHKDDHCSITDCGSSAQTGDTVMMRAPTSPSSFPLPVDDSSPTGSGAGYDKKQLALGIKPKEAATKGSKRSKRMNKPTIAGVEETRSEENQTAIDAKSQPRATTKRNKRVKNKSKCSEMEGIAPEEQQEGSLKHKTKNTHLEHKTDHHFAKAMKRRNTSTPATPGAVPVQGRNKMVESIHEVVDIIEVPDATGPDVEQAPSPSFIASARLVEGDDDNINADFERRLQQAVESQLWRNDVFVAEAVQVNPDGTLRPAVLHVEKKICGMAIKTCRIVSVIMVIVVLGVLVGAGVAVINNGSTGSVASSPTAAPSESSPSAAPSESGPTAVTSTILPSSMDALFQELEPWIIRTEEDEFQIHDSSSPQSYALDWLSSDDITLADDRLTSTVLERYVLAVLYYATDGPTWARQGLDFLTEADVCSWNNQLASVDEAMLGIFCDEQSSVQKIILDDLGLAGALPWELSLLSELQVLSMSGNALTGSIATEFGNLDALEILNIGENNLIGTIPTEIGFLNKVIILQIYKNALVGTLPTELGQLNFLTWLDLSGNLLTGTLPTELSWISILEAFLIYDDQLKGTIPPQFGRWRNLKWFCADNNDITGTIPTEFGQLTALGNVNFLNNMLTGPLPTELGQLTAITYLRLTGNVLTGTLPTELGHMTSLLEFQVESNSFIGTLPTELAALTRLQNLNVPNNRLTGTLPTQFGRMTAFQRFHAESNALTGTLPTELATLTTMTEMSLSLNKFIGTLPSEWGQLTALQELRLDTNSLTGTLPTELGGLTSLRWVSLQNNEFTGTVPRTLSQWGYVMDFLFSGNNLTGSVNDVLCTGAINWVILQGDCLATNDVIETQCQCCNSCCDANGENCQEM